MFHLLSRTVCAALFAAVLLSAQTSLDLEGRYWVTQMRSTFRIQRNGLGTDIDARQDLGMSDRGFPLGGFTFHRGRHLLRFAYTPIDFSGDRTLTRSVNFNGRQYTFGTRALSGLTIQHLQLGWSYQFIHLREGLIRLGPLVQADGFLMRGSLRAPDLNPPFEETAELSAGLPTVGLALDIAPHRRIDIFGQVSGMQAGRYGYFVGSDSGVRIRLPGHLLLTAGYRTFNLHIENDPDFARLRLRGPFFGAGFHF